MERIEEDIVITNGHGLHVRPAAEFVRIASKFHSTVTFVKDDEVVDAKSIIAILSMGVNNGTMIKLVVEGSDASEAFAELKDFLEKSSE